MPRKPDPDYANTSSEAIFAIAGRLDTSNRLKKKKSVEQVVTHAYSIEDGYNVGSGLLKFSINLSNKNSSQIHDWFVSTEGMIVSGLITSFTIFLSWLSTYFEDDTSKTLKAYIFSTFWLYLRDIIKGLKNIYKSFGSAIALYDFFTVGQNLKTQSSLNYLRIPLGLGVFGILNVGLRCYMRSINKTRKDMDIMNDNLIALILESQSIDKELQKKIANFLRKQAIQMRRLYPRNMTMIGVGATLESCYLFMNDITLCVGPADTFYNYLENSKLSSGPLFCTLPPPILALMVVLCVFYSIANIASRLNEEYLAQQEFKGKQAKVDLVLYTQKYGLVLEEKVRELTQIKTSILKPRNDKDLIEHQRILQRNISILANVFQRKYERFQDLNTPSLFSHIILGLQNGLKAQSVLSVLMYAISTILYLSSITFPPMLLIACLSAGMVFITGFIVQSVMHYYQYKEKQEAKNLKLSAGWNKLLADNEINSVILKKIREEPKIKQNYPKIQEWLEVFRSLFSGSEKSLKEVEFAGVSFQEKSDTGYKDTIPMYIAMFILAPIIAGIRSARAYFRGKLSSKAPAPSATPIQDSQPLLIGDSKEKQKEMTPSRMTRMLTSSASNSGKIEKVQKIIIPRKTPSLSSSPETSEKSPSSSSKSCTPPRKCHSAENYGLYTKSSCRERFTTFGHSPGIEVF